MRYYVYWLDPILRPTHQYFYSLDDESIVRRLVDLFTSLYGKERREFGVETLADENARFLADFDIDQVEVRAAAQSGKSYFMGYRDDIHESNEFRVKATLWHQRMLDQQGVKRGNARLPASNAVGRSNRVRPMTDGEKYVWDALDTRILSAQGVAGFLLENRDHDTSPETVRNHIKNLRAKDYRIDNEPRRGYWRPDAPPPELQTR